VSGKKAPRAILLGNEAIGRGLVEAGCHVVASYPGTPSSEILPAVVRFKKMEKSSIFTHWAVNEKVAFDEALAAAYTGKRAAVIMKQVGLNVASDSLMSAVYTGVKGGFVVISADDPGPHSSQTEQDSRFFALFAKIPVFDPSDPLEAKEMVAEAFALSEEYEIPVMLRPSIRICHARMDVPLEPVTLLERPARFKKNPHRWAATPAYRFHLHKQLNEKLVRIRSALERSPGLNYLVRDDGGAAGTERAASGEAGTGGDGPKKGIIAAGVSFAVVKDILGEAGLGDRFSVLKIGTPHPLPADLVDAFLAEHDDVLVLEDPDYTIELQVKDKSNLHGRLDGSVPPEGELTPEVIYRVLSDFAGGIEGAGAALEWVGSAESAAGEIGLEVRRPTLCPGCGHRAAFYAIRKALPRAIFTSDIGCYTLGINLKAVDTVLDMGAGLTLATGLYHAYRQDGKLQPVVATMGDSTFYHSGVPALIDAVASDARFIFVLLDNSITAMTGMQPTPNLGIMADGEPGKRVELERLIRGCGIEFLRKIDPYRISDMKELLKEAFEYTAAEDGGVAVIISERPCLVAYRDEAVGAGGTVAVAEDCDGCKLCITQFECPALVFDESKNVVEIDRMLCVDCGVCIEACQNDSIRMEI